MSLGYKDPRWQQKRLDRFNAAAWKCVECGSQNNELHLHHYWYEKNCEPWEYPDDCFAVLCDECHSLWHAKKLVIDKQLQFTLQEMDQAAGLIAGMRCHISGVDFLFSQSIDALTVVAVVRGFWPPLDYQKLIIDECLARASRNEAFSLSSVIYQVVPLELSEFAFLANWYDNATVNNCKQRQILS